jgi:hypothetical protein
MAAVNVAYWHPYSIVAFNQLLGGAKTGAWAFTIGWGEGLSDAADWLNQQPDITGVRVATTMRTGLQSYLRPGAQSLIPAGTNLPPETGYVVVYARDVQWNLPQPPFDRFYGREIPAHIVRIHGIDYAWIYQVPPQVEQPKTADFGPIRLHGYSWVDVPERGKPLKMHLVWQAQAQPPVDIMLFAHLIGVDGKPYARVDLPYQTSQWAAGRYQKTELAVLLPADIPAGTYQLVIGLYDPSSGARLPLQVEEPIDPALDGPDALPLAQITLRVP